jgi:pimeloyl-ACP methyl ester carboxylesterase
MNTVKVDGRAIAYERAGQGPPLVLLHGYVGDGPTTWRPQLDALSDEFAGAALAESVAAEMGITGPAGSST